LDGANQELHKADMGCALKDRLRVRKSIRKKVKPFQTCE
jgi:hypothetical protein